jgi:hypothetical protein
MRRGLCIIGALSLFCMAAASPQQNSGKPQPTSNNDVAAALENVATALQRNDEAPGYQDACEKGGEDRSSDLCAQWYAADAAKSGADASWLFGYIGTLLGVMTFGAAAAAAIYAAKAAHETKRGAKAAEDGLALGRDVSAAELRPYLFVDRLELIDRKTIPVHDTEPPEDELSDETPTAFSATVVVHLRNFGKIPARNIRVFLKEYYAWTYKGRFWGFRFSDVPLPNCAPGHERRLFGRMYITSDEHFSFTAGALSRIIRLRYTFEDDSGHVFEERAGYILYGNDLETFYLLTELRIAELRERAKQYQTYEFDFGDEPEPGEQEA